ncbi:hypothetical protein LZ30DRAFT_482947 [Colletotrichum cereale]|nr:hypothetical protein LZ30DRAFT_482947 [Colletotrichum cereale]
MTHAGGSPGPAIAEERLWSVKLNPRNTAHAQAVRGTLIRTWGRKQNREKHEIWCKSGHVSLRIPCLPSQYVEVHTRDRFRAGKRP